MKQTLIFVFGSFFFFFILARTLMADSTCSVTVDPTTVPNGQQVTLVWTITNTGESPLLWVRFTLPRNTSFSNLTASADSWNVLASTSRDSQLAGGSIDPGNSTDFTTIATTGSTPFTNVYWTVYGADIGDGTTAVVCSGIPGISSGSGGGPTYTPTPTTQPTSTQTPTPTPTPTPTTSQQSPTVTTSFSPTIATQTPTPTTSSQASTDTQQPTATPTPVAAITVLASDKKNPIISITQPTNNLTTNENIIQLKGTATDESGIVALAISSTNGNSWESISDVTGLLTTKTTFAIAIAPVKEGKYIYQIKATDASGNIAISPPIQITIDREGPKITWYTQPNKLYTKPPSLTVHVEDSVGIETIFASVDQTIWTPLPFSTSQPTATDITFTPPTTDDGTYIVHVQAIDKLGNATTSDKKTFAIDTIPPGFGPQILNMGSFVLPTAQGSQFIPTDTQFSYTLETLGGVIRLRMILTHSEDNTTTTYLLSPTKTRNVWTTPLSLPKAGVYTITLEGTDDAGTTTKTLRPPLIAIPRGTIQSKKGPVQGAEAKLYTFDSVYQKYNMWDGSLYNQSNPQITIEDGGYAFNVPPGTYYISVRAPGLQTFTSQPFTVNEKTFLISDIQLSPTLPFPLNILKPSDSKYEKPRSFKSLLSAPEPSINNMQTALEKLFASQPVPEYLVMTSMWHPDTPSLMLRLDKLTLAGKSIGVILPGVSESVAAVWKSRGNWLTPVFTDLDYNFTATIAVQWIPTVIRLDPSGKVIQREWDLLPITRMIEQGRL